MEERPPVKLEPEPESSPESNEVLLEIDEAEIEAMRRRPEVRRFAVRALELEKRLVRENRIRS